MEDIGTISREPIESDRFLIGRKRAISEQREGDSSWIRRRRHYMIAHSDFVEGILIYVLVSRETFPDKARTDGGTS